MIPLHDVDDNGFVGNRAAVRRNEVEAIQPMCEPNKLALAPYHRLPHKKRCLPQKLVSNPPVSLNN
jgi:hypothetical protein